MIPSLDDLLNKKFNIGKKERVAVHNPANGELVSWIPVDDTDDVDRVMERADSAFKSWRRSSPAIRSNLLNRAATLLADNLEPIARLLTQEQGKPLRDSRKELTATVRVLQYYAGDALRIQGPAQWGRDGDTFSLVLRQPIGPVIAISPSNYPVELLAWKVAPALAAGCTVVAKPSIETPLAATALMSCLVEAGAPAGTVGLVIGPGSTIGDYLVCHPLARKVAFTGSTRIGRHLAALLGEKLKPFTLELGGSAPFLVFADADLELTVAAALRRSTSNAGQICIAVNRIYVEEPLYNNFVEAFVSAARKLTVADGLKEPEADMGPLVSQSACDHVAEHISDALHKGASLALGGQRLAGEAYDKGYFFAPTVLTRVNQTMRCMHEETFGPVAPIAPFKDDTEALELANDTSYGLAAYLYTRDLKRAFRFVTGLEAGGVGINVNDITEFTMPFGGWKDSGIGRELGTFGLESYLQTKHVRIRVYQNRSRQGT